MGAVIVNSYDVWLIEPLIKELMEVVGEAASGGDVVSWTREQLLDSDTFCFCWVEDEKPLGYVLAAFYRDHPMGPTVKIHSVYAARRHLGIGRRLFHLVELTGKRGGAKRIEGTIYGDYRKVIEALAGDHSYEVLGTLVAGPITV